MNAEGARVAEVAARRAKRKCWWADLDDLRQEAALAVHQAAGTFDPGVGVPFGVARSLPLQELPAREKHAYHGAGNCVEADECVVRQTDEPNSRLSQLPAC